MKRALLAIAIVVVLAACKTAPAEIPSDLSQAELIQNAQESADNENWDAALAYYQAILDRFPQDRSAVVAAQYEMAFINYKQGNLTEAQAGFERLVGMYDFGEADLPEWPKVLAEKLLDEIALREEALPGANAPGEGTQ